MYTHRTNLRVRYAETDQMGYVYYGQYATYLEVARVELIRSLGTSYKELEEAGVMLPVLSLEVKYIKPARYDDNLIIYTYIKEMPAARITFDYKITNESGTLLTKAATILVFVDKKTGKPRRLPDNIKEALQTHF